MPSGRYVATSSTEFVSIYRYNMCIYTHTDDDDEDDDVYIRDRKRAPPGIGRGGGGGIKKKNRRRVKNCTVEGNPPWPRGYADGRRRRKTEMTTATAGGNRLCRTVGAREQRTERDPGGARGILNFGQLSPHTRTWPSDSTATAAVCACGVQRTAGGGASGFCPRRQRAKEPRASHFNARACVCACVRWEYALVDWKKGTPPESAGVRYGAAKGVVVAGGF
uniref:Uncharacterized protein n=1 Tax=Schizaphis graminum TaxID=13262 RepID=A0A2S2NHU7_SCHGA